MYQCVCGKLFEAPMSREAHFASCPEMARIEERKRMGKWLDEHVMYALLKADMEGYEFKAVLQNLKQGKLPGDVK